MCVVTAILRLVPCVNAAWPYREAGVAGRFALPAGGSLLEAPSGLMDVRLSEPCVPGALLSRRVALYLGALRASWTFAFFGHKKAPSLERDEAILALPP